MLGPVYDERPKGQGVRAHVIYLIDVFARLVVYGLLLWGIIVVLLGTGR